jgi:hypothetical protein
MEKGFKINIDSYSIEFGYRCYEVDKSDFFYPQQMNDEFIHKTIEKARIIKKTITKYFKDYLINIDDIISDSRYILEDNKYDCDLIDRETEKSLECGLKLLKKSEKSTNIYFKLFSVDAYDWNGEDDKIKCKLKIYIETQIGLTSLFDIKKFDGNKNKKYFVKNNIKENFFMSHINYKYDLNSKKSYNVCKKKFLNELDTYLDEKCDEIEKVTQILKNNFLGTNYIGFEVSQFLYSKNILSAYNIY